MKKNIIYAILATVLICSCGEDRTYEYLELTKENQWIYEKMEDIYLWSDSIKPPKHQKFFANSNTFFKDLLQPFDKSSHFSDSALTTGYGISYALFRDPLGPPASRYYYALVKFVAPGSPAYKAGLKRGDWISQVGKNLLNSTNYGYLDRGEATTIYTCSIELDDETMEYKWRANDTLQIESAREYTTESLYLDSIYTLRNHKIGYLVCNNFADNGLDNTLSAISNFKEQHITDLILDLRYNNAGSIEAACRVASAIIPAEHDGETFCTLTYNNLNSDKNTEYTYTADATTLALNKIYIVCSAATRGASEALISSLKTTLGEDNVTTIGEATYGANTITESIASPYNFTISPTVAYIGNEQHESLFAGSIAPTHQINEFENLYNIYPIGSKQEYILYNIFYYIVNNSFPQN